MDGDFSHLILFLMRKVRCCEIEIYSRFGNALGQERNNFCCWSHIQWASLSIKEKGYKFE
jgi:hypothetical protein